MSVEENPLFQEAICIRCGGPVIQDNDWRMCSSCVKRTEKDRKEMISSRKSVDKRAPNIKTVQHGGIVYTFMEIPKDKK